MTHHRGFLGSNPKLGIFVQPTDSHFLLTTFHAMTGAWAAHHRGFLGSTPKLGRVTHPATSHFLLLTSHAPSGAWLAHHLGIFNSTPKLGRVVQPLTSHMQFHHFPCRPAPLGALRRLAAALSPPPSITPAASFRTVEAWRATRCGLLILRRLASIRKLAPGTLASLGPVSIP